jgi:hypothetical protein
VPGEAAALGGVQKSGEPVIRFPDKLSSETILQGGCAGVGSVQKEVTKEMKLTNILGQTNRSFASVFVAFSLFGFLFPHHANQVKQNHKVNLITTEQATQQEPADDGSQYAWNWSLRSPSRTHNAGALVSASTLAKWFY